MIVFFVIPFMIKFHFFEFLNRDDWFHKDVFIIKGGKVSLTFDILTIQFSHIFSNLNRILLIKRLSI